MSDEDAPSGSARRTGAARERDVLVALQAALLPAGVPVLPRVALGASYLIAEADAGGDWYDTVVRADGSVGLVVGDLAGHGVAAAAAMGQLRAVAHHCLDTAVSPAAVVAELDRFADQVPEARSATVCVALLHPTTGAVRYCTAGHPRPLLITAAGSGSRYLAPSGNGPLFTGSAYQDRHAHLADSDLLLLYTDGILAQPGAEPPADRLADVAVAAAVRRPPVGVGAPDIFGRFDAFDALDALDAAQRVCDQTLARIVEHTGGRDDTTLLAAGRHPAVGPVELTLPDTPATAATVRAALDAWMTALRFDRLTGAAVQHAVGEIVTNAVVHAHPEAPDGAHQLTVRAELTDTGQLQVAVADDGRWRTPTPGPHRGVGLALAAELVDELAVERKPGGTTVYLRRAVTRPVPMLTTTATAAPTALRSRSAPSRPAVLADEPFVAALTEGADLDAVLVVGGPVDAVSAVVLRDQLGNVTEGGTLTRTVDLSGVTLLGSAGVHVLFEARRRSLAHHEHLHLLAPRGSPAWQVLERVGLDVGDTPSGP